MLTLEACLQAQLSAYLDWLRSRGVRLPVFVDSAIHEQNRFADPVRHVPLLLYSNTKLSASDQELLQRIGAFASNYCTPVEIVWRGDEDADLKLKSSAESGAKIILFQLTGADALQLCSPATKNVLVTATADALGSNPRLKRQFWLQLQVLLGIRHSND